MLKAESNHNNHNNNGAMAPSHVTPLAQRVQGKPWSHEGGERRRSSRGAPVNAI